ncbi:MAG: glycosyltransferase family 2 protein [Pseudomonadota bacterium]|nr:glycosyltransferase family 2 protein [Pseudomonadota bacterium]
MELTILMPCLDEALTVETCIRKAQTYLRNSGIDGEILVADNGSTDGSQSLAEAAGARVVQIDSRGYGAALIGGIAAAKGRYVIMADADDSYDFTDLDGFVERLRRGIKLVIGNRFKGRILPGAMPPLNRYVGNPLLSYIGRTLFLSPVGDFHCGIRGFERQAILELRLRSSGMEFASEMVVKASLAHLSITEVPTTLRPDGRHRTPHLRPWRDGWRHLRFMLLRSPHWLFLYPGLVLAGLGLVGAATLTIAPIRIPNIFTLDINALLYFSISAILGVQITFFGLFAIAFARKINLNVARGLPEQLLRLASLEAAITVGAFLVVAGSSGALFAILKWGHSSFGPLVPSDMMRITIPSVTTLAIGTQVIFGSFLLGFIEID